MVAVLDQLQTRRDATVPCRRRNQWAPRFLMQVPCFPGHRDGSLSFNFDYVAQLAFVLLDYCPSSGTCIQSWTLR